MNNREIADILQLAASLGELHGENPFKLKAYSNAAFQISKKLPELAQLSQAEIEAQPGIGKGIAEKIRMLLHGEIFEELAQWTSATPKGVIEMLQVKGLGPKKVKMLWDELGIESPGELLYACKENRLIGLKGFGAKTQESIMQVLEFAKSSQGQWHYAEAMGAAAQLIEEITAMGYTAQMAGALRRQNNTVEAIELYVSGSSTKFEEDYLKIKGLQSTDLALFTFLWLQMYPVKIYWADKTSLLQATGPATHLETLTAQGIDTKSASETEAYQSLGLPYLLPPWRDWPLQAAANFSSERLVQYNHIKGCLHNHTNYSDGLNTLAEMAEACIEQGWEYLGVCDHSQSAFYANGLKEDRLVHQWQEIDRLNAQFSSFRILKGIESDILSNGALDYPASILAQFDFVVASIHSNLRMDIDKANTRLIKAIENPYTSILGHPTGRLLLSRPAYPIDHKKIIDACAANGVAIELNAHPYRLDIDWQWLPYCMEKGVKVSINPDAHERMGLLDMKWGIASAQKGGLTKEFLLNALDLVSILEIFRQKHA